MSKIIVKVVKPISADTGTYGGMKDVIWGSEVDARWIKPEMASDPENPKHGVMIRGEEFIRIGGCPEAFKGNYEHLWGTFEVVK